MLSGFTYCTVPYRAVKLFRVLNGALAAGNARSVKKHIFGFERPGKVALGHHVGRQVSVEPAVGGQVPV